MSTFREANQVRTSLKMKLSNYSWYKSSRINTAPDGWEIVIVVKKLDNKVRKVISPVVDGISIRTEVD